MTAPKPKLDPGERKLANRAAGGRANAETTAWVLERRTSPGMTLAEFQRKRAREDADSHDSTES